MNNRVKITYKQYIEFVGMTQDKINTLYYQKGKYMREYHIKNENEHVHKFIKMIEKYEGLLRELELMEVE